MELKEKQQRSPRQAQVDERVKPVARPKEKIQQQQSEEGAVAEESASIPTDLESWIRNNAKDLKIRLTDRRWAAEVVNDFRENLLKFLNNEHPLFKSAECLNAGSYFEKVKIHMPDEFDMMVTFPGSPNLRLNLTKLDGGLFYRLDLTRPTRQPIKAFLLENTLTLSSSKVLNEMHRLVRKFLKTYKVPDECCRWEVNRKRVHSPAVTLSLFKTEKNSEELISVDVVPALEVQSWPAAVRNGPDVTNWLGKKALQEIRGLPVYFVPKRQKGRNLSEDAKESWRISFSHIEKKIITSHGNKKTCCESNPTKCCRKQCLMLLKSLIEGLKQRFPEKLDDLCSYHGKTTFLHTLSTRYDDAKWDPRNLPVCFLYLVRALEDYASRGNLPHFFVPECNLFSPSSFSRKSLAFLVNALKEQMREGLPLLKPPALVSPLIPREDLDETCNETFEERSFVLVHSVDAALMNKLGVAFAVVVGFAFYILFN
ncbi:cyclic GMP-AMP synthase [Oreochromis aureus]|uniref:Cyclic GMP-AMP synthase n=1 Tax=Oreochromis aureus TaxID=47969 RepID=A0AAZ1X6R9_OREAU|nr:cyclic GMP-AMP synthase [Oreochromis aureus]XP_039461226.1 cyclic GMP-AMP synthase [Oreochromis aureus]